MQFPCTLTANGQNLSHEGVLIIDIPNGQTLAVFGDYVLENIMLKQDWTIAEESFNTQGNKFNLAINQQEVSDFTLSFEIQDTLRSGSELLALSIRIEYVDWKERVYLQVLGLEAIFESDSLENAFLSLLKSHSQLKVCANCRLAGYERGGTALFCFLQDKERCLQEPSKYHYHNWFGDLKRNETIEFYGCEEWQ